MTKIPFFTLPLHIEAADVENLKKENATLLRYLERGLPLTPGLIQNLKMAMRTVLWKQKDFETYWQQAEYEKINLHLQCGEHDILNLPWRLAVEERQFLYLTKSIQPLAVRTFEPSASPLKILVMVSAPDNSTISGRLSYEVEEDMIIRAFGDLFTSNQIEVDFTDDGSLPSLQRKLQENHYHILHFSGHGVYKNGKGYLQLENELSFDSVLVSGSEFAKALIETNNTPDLVLLASCQTAQGGTSDLEGVTDELLRAKVPAVIGMSFSVLDNFASLFAADFYKNIAAKYTVAQAFYQALAFVKQQEQEKRLLGNLQLQPGQWMIPQLYLSQPMEGLVDWQKPQNTLSFATLKYVIGEQKEWLVKEHHDGYRFLGRRRERKKTLAALLAQRPQPILLQGQGGVGKTSMAEHLVQRLIVNDRTVYPFWFNETISGVPDMLRQIITFFEQHTDEIFIEDEMKEGDRATDVMKQYRFLLQQLIKNKTVKPIFVFDNVETFQDLTTKQFKPIHHDILQAIQMVSNLNRFPIICTGRYPIAEMDNLTVFNLNEVRAGDFYIKCRQLQLGNLKIDHDDKPIKFDQIVELLHKTFGGNYRRLEFFDTLYTEKKDGIYATLKKLQDLENALVEDKPEVLQEAAKDLLFHQLLDLVSDTGRQALAILKHFRVPVLPLALQKQGFDSHINKTLQQLLDLTLIEKHDLPYDNMTLTYYYMPPLVKDLLPDTTDAFNQNAAGSYFEYIQKHIDSSPAPHEEAFYHYILGDNQPKVNDIGDRLCQFYYDIQLFNKSLQYGLLTEQVVGENTDGRIWNNIGQIYKLYGNSVIALEYFEKSLANNKKQNNLKGEGANLNNLAGIALTKGDYEQALTHLEQSLKITQDVCDRQGEGRILNNISQIHKATGDYAKALTYLEQSLKIMRAIGDRQGEGRTLSNISQIYDAQGDYAQALTYLEQSLKITQDIGDRQGEGGTLNNIATTAYAKGDYAQALTYLEQSLKIMRAIGDRQGESYTLHNIACIYLEQYQDISKFMEYEVKAYQMALAINDANGIVQIGDYLGDVLCEVGMKEEGLQVLHRSFAIAHQSGMAIAAKIYQKIQQYT